ncbi:MAG: TetR/AcrR family transcriptional regulator [Spirochaetes bacterium]|jgi:TetR/AcrR family transcriptional repressor of cmeABC operon|nr:TetR/AcrR family transcriptional regulator [Spirochaetota bacterium]
MKGSDTKERILKEALSAFALHGYDGARMDKIAAAVGINKASLYFHFKSKEEIFRELFNGILRKYKSFIRRTADLVSGLETRERLDKFCHNYLQDSFDNPEIDFWNRIYYLPPAQMRDDILKLTKDDKECMMTELAKIIDDGKVRKQVRDIDSKKAASILYYSLTCVALSKDIMTKKEGLSDMKDCLDFFWQSISK